MYLLISTSVYQGAALSSGGTIGQVGGKDLGDQSFFIGLIEGVQTAGEEGKGCAHIDAAGLSFF